MKAKQRASLGVVSLTALVVFGCSQPSEGIKRESPTSAAPTSSEPSTIPVSTELTCPKNTSGASMVLIPTGDGTDYCIDQWPATYGEYKEFLRAKGRRFGDQPSGCEWNKDYGPHSTYETYGCDDCPTSTCGPAIDEVDPGRAVQCIDWCDAWAFCAWSGKRLCGLRGAQRGKVSSIELPPDNYDNAEARNRVIDKSTCTPDSEWFNVCSQGGTSKYPYGNAYEAGTCADEEKLAFDSTVAPPVSDTARNQCHGTQSPYDQVYGVSGSVPQWLNICFDFPGFCAIQGNPERSYQSSSCEGSHGLMFVIPTANSYAGVRCCADAVPGVAFEP